MTFLIDRHIIIKEMATRPPLTYENLKKFVMIKVIKGISLTDDLSKLSQHSTLAKDINRFNFAFKSIMELMLEDGVITEDDGLYKIDPGYVSEDNETNEISKSKPIKYYSGTQIMKLQLPDNRYVIEKLIPENCITILVGKRSTYKSWLVYQFIKSILRKDDLWGMYPTIKKKILIIDEENTLQRIQRRLKMVFHDDMKLLDDITVINKQLIKVNDPESRAKLEEIIEKVKPDMVFVDTMARVYTNLDENSARDVNDFFVDCLGPLMTKHNLTFVLLHHDRKSDSNDDMDTVRGSSEFVNIADSVIKTKMIDKNITNIFMVNQVKARDDPIQQAMRIKANIDDDKETADFVFDGFIDSDTSTLVSMYQKVIIEWATENKIGTATNSEIAEEIARLENKNVEDIRRNVNKTLALLLRVGMVQRHKKGHYTFGYDK